MSVLYIAKLISLSLETQDPYAFVLESVLIEV